MLKMLVAIAASTSFQFSIAAEGTNSGKPTKKKIQNSYIVNPANPFLPVKLNSSSNAEHGRMITDFGEPDEPGTLTHPSRSSDGKSPNKAKPEGKHQQALNYIPAKINLGEIAFEGRVIEPRIKFAPSRLEQQQSHDVANDRYFSKIYSILEKSDF